MTIASTPATLHELRQQARELLNEFDPADGLAAYYALHHDPNRTALYVHQDPGGSPDGFLVRCQTGIDLFRPLVTLRLRGLSDPIPALIDPALAAGRPYLLVLPEPLLERVKPHLTLTSPVRSLIMRLEPSRLRTEINVLVVLRRDADGSPRAEIRHRDEPAALAGVNWRSSNFAEVFVQVQPEFRRRGWGRSVVRAVAVELLKLRVTPLFTTAEDNDEALNLAEDVGFVSTGAVEITVQAVRG